MEYTDLTILDCNRSHSIQAIAGNNENTALYTNELGRGIELNAGDRVSVQGAYISEIGAGADTIELKGESFGKGRTIKYIHEVEEYPTTLNDTEAYPSTDLADPLITGYQRLRSEEREFTYELKDNETYITNQYYLNTSGDSGYVFLPRRFVYPSTINASTWTEADSYSNGRASNQIAGQFASCDYMYIEGGDRGTTNASGFYRLQSDCSRLTLLRRIDDADFHSTDLRAEIKRENGGVVGGRYPEFNIHPSHATYKIYKDYFKISINTGFTSPENMGDEITRQLKIASPPQVFQKIDNSGEIRDISVYFSTNTYKPFLCGSLDTFTKDKLDEFIKPLTDGTKDKQKSQDYNSNYYNIYCKRPEIREAGQELNTYQGLSLKNDLYTYDRPDAVLILDLEWSEDNLQKLKKFFSAQKLYPELFDNYNFSKMQGPFFSADLQDIVINSVDNTRYVHMNQAQFAGDNDYLGGDNMNTTEFEGDPVEPTRQSLPAFIYFDKNLEEKYTEGADQDNLSYGFGLKREVGGVEYIALTTEKIGGLNDRLFGPPDARHGLGAGNRIGADYSFNCYGGVYACGLNGRCDKDYAQVNEWGILNASSTGVEPKNLTSGLLRYNYIGSNNPIFKYDPEQSRFFFSGLHTPEVAGQVDINAGDNGQSPAVQDNTAQGGVSVYKLNKRINEYVYSPDMRPYDKSASGHYTDTDIGNKERTLSIKNRNIKSWSIFDSICGVYFSDLGYDKEDFDRGLWGLLGFEYDQLFSNPTGTNNRTTRITQDDKLSIITTNCNIVSSDTRDFITNQFGAVFFTNQLPTQSIITFSDHGNPLNQIDPAISQSAVSFQILGSKLPRKMLRPYYTIRSDIIDSNHYVGGTDSKSILPVVAICDKQYSGGDFVFGAENEFTFTITKKKVITTITTAITDPNQSFARVDADSAVIYKIEKNRRAEQDLIPNYLKALEKENEKLKGQ